MRILIDLQAAQSGSRLGGIGRYSLALAKAMIRQGAEHDFFLLLNKKLPAVHQIRDQFRALLPQHKILVFDIPSGIAWSLGNISRIRLAELIRERLIADLQPDVVHISSLIEGLGDDVVTSVGELFPASRTAVTLYDLIPLAQPERYLTNHVLEEHYLNKIMHMRRAGMLLSISEYSRLEGVEFGGFSPDRVVNISSAVDEKFKPRMVSSERRKALFRHFGIRNEFLMFTGSFDARKNHSRLIEAFSRLPLEVRSGYQLLVVGNGNDIIYDDLWGLAQSHGLKGHDLLFSGHIDDDDLLDLYNLCTLFVFPPLWEGFGLPVLEAMSCGAPTIGSNTTSIPEVIGREDAMFDPTDVASIAEKMQQALTDNDFRDVLKRHALAYAKNFSWDISARKALDFFEAKLGSPEFPNDLKDEKCAKDNAETYSCFLQQAASISGVEVLEDDVLRASSAALATNEILAAQSLSDRSQSLKVGWVTTWNDRCGIASYSKHLVNNCDCISTIFAPITESLTEPDGEEVIRCWTAGSDNLCGLSEAIDRSSVDVVAIQMNYGFFDFSALARLIDEQKCLGRTVTITLHATVDPPSHILNRRLTDLALSLNACDFVLVHSCSDVDNLCKIGVVDNVELFPQGVVTPEFSRKRQKIKDGPFVLGTYGFFLPHKGLEQVVEAVALLRSRGIDVELEMVNAEYSLTVSGPLIQKCKELIEKNGLTPHVRMITEYLDEQDSLLRISEMDLVLFAYQGTGESSSAAVRMGLTSGTLVAVTPLEIFSDVDGLVVKMPGIASEELALGIQSTIKQIENDDPELQILRENSKRWVECHQFGNQAQFFCNLIEQMRS